MKFIIPKADLLELIGAIQNVVSPRMPTIPILANVLVEACNDELVLTATDLTVGIRCYTSAKIFQEGATTIPARRFFQLIRELPDINIEIHRGDNDMVNISAGASRFRIHGMSRKEFPVLPDLSGATQIQLPQSTLREALYRTAFAVPRQDNRLVLTGVLCKIKGGYLTFVGTDGKRLAKHPLRVDFDPTFSGSYILPLKAVEEVVHLTKESEEVATIYLLQDRVALEIGHVTIITKLINGDYPDVDQVIPSSSNIRVPLHREELASLLRQVSLFTSEKSCSARFSFSDSELTLSANTADVGEGKVSMPVNYQGEPLDIAFNPHYFLDILRHTTDETVDLALTDAFNPGVISDSSAGLFVLMPMRLTESA